MDSCLHCHHELHWDDDTCPGCGATHAHIDADGLAKEATEIRRSFYSRIRGYGFGALVVVTMALTGIGRFWAEAIVWAIIGTIGLIAWLVVGVVVTRRMQRLTKHHKAVNLREQHYAQFLKETPNCKALLPKLRHEAFRKWLSSYDDLLRSGAEQGAGDQTPAAVEWRSHGSTNMNPESGTRRQ